MSAPRTGTSCCDGTTARRGAGASLRRLLVPVLFVPVLLVPVLLGAACDASPPSPAAPGPSSAPPPRAASSPASAAAAGTVDVGPAAVDAIHERTGGAQEGDRVPLVVVVHGLGGRPEELKGLFAGFGGKAHFVYPAGGLRWGSGFAWWPINGPIDGDNMARGLGSAAARLGPAVRGWRDAHTAGKPIITGFSQGGMLSFTLAARYPEDIGEALPISGFVPAALLPSEWPAGAPRPRIVALHGEADERVAFSLAQRSVAALRALGLDVELKSYAGVGHSISPDMRRDLFAALTAALERAEKASP